MKVLLTVLLLAAASATARDDRPLCDEKGFNKTLTACGKNGENAANPVCIQRYRATVMKCQQRITDRKDNPQVVADTKGYLSELMDIRGAVEKAEAQLGPPTQDEKPTQAELQKRRVGGQPAGAAKEDAPPDLVEEAGAALQAGDAPKALKSVQRALEEDPDDTEALRLRAQIHLEQGDAVAAAADARRILELSPDDEFARVVLGQSESLSRTSDKLKGVRLDFDSKDDEGLFGGGERPDGSRPEGSAGFVSGGGGAPAAVAGATGLQVWQVASRHFSLGDWTSALFHATRYLKLAPNDPKGWLLRARISNKLKNWAAAESDARRALELSPDDPAALLELGYALLQQGRAAEALTHIERALTLDPKNGLGYLYLGQTLEALGRKDEAVDAYRKAARLERALIPLVDAALARLGAGGEVPSPASPPPWRMPLRLLSAAVAAAFLAKGLQVVLGARRRATTGPLPAPDPGQAASGGTPVPGTVLGGQFRIERELARGGMGVVFEATDTVLNRPVAIKRLHRAAGESSDVRRKFLQEAQLAARLKHPNLAQIFSVFGDDELYLVFELVEGSGLDAVLARRGSLGLGEVRDLMRQACSALTHAHTNRVIHRDLKPANMMVASDGTLKLMDFGIAHEARTMSAATQTQAWGTPPYMAPEQEDGYVLPASDLYALAVTAYELLSGRRPFDGPGLIGAKRAKSYTRLGGAYDAFFDRALEPDPARRFATAADFTAAFDALITPEMPPGKEGLPGGRLRR